MGRAIVRDPKAFLMDEPLSNLDAKLRVQMRAEIARLQHRLGTTTVYVTHDQTEAMTLGDRVAVMHRGVLQQVDAPRVLYESPANLFVAGFIGSPAMNLVGGELAGPELHTPLGALRLDDAVRRSVERSCNGRRDVVIGIRPEDLDVASELNGSGATHSFEVPIELTETVGPDLYAHFHFNGGGGELGVARLDSASRVRRGQRLELGLDLARVHIFDARDGRSLVHH
jgi:multiple sugar transport system ATP-binding protein